MQPFVMVSGPAAPLPTPNIDTDVIIPKQFLKGVDRAGLDRGTFFDLRFDAQGKPREDFILNQAPWRDAKFLVTGPNFGCGSSREHAVWGLSQLGIRALIGTSFAGIFNDNCARNGILTIALPTGIVAELLKRVAIPETNELTIDLVAQTITAAGGELVLPFEIDALRKDALLNGQDAVGVTLDRHAEEICAFERKHKDANPWFF